MEIQNSTMAAPAAAQPAPPPAQPDGRASADVAAVAKDPSPEIPMPVPAAPTQVGLVSKSAMAEKEAGPKTEASGLSAAERRLKPYGINMLPEKTDAPKQEAPAE